MLRVRNLSSAYPNLHNFLNIIVLIFLSFMATFRGLGLPVLSPVGAFPSLMTSTISFWRFMSRLHTSLHSPLISSVSSCTLVSLTFVAGSGALNTMEFVSLAVLSCISLTVSSRTDLSCVVLAGCLFVVGALSLVPKASFTISFTSLTSHFVSSFFYFIDSFIYHMAISDTFLLNCFFL